MVIPGLPHHVAQRGNRRQRTFFRDIEYDAHIDLMSKDDRLVKVKPLLTPSSAGNPV